MVDTLALPQALAVAPKRAGSSPLVTLVACALCVCMTGCSSSGSKEQNRAPEAKPEVSLNSPNGKARAIVFIHGIHGSAEDTWQVPNGPYWPKLISDDNAFQNADVVVKGYPTPFTGNKNDVKTIANALADELRDTFANHNQVLFICHSLGGLITKQMLLDRPEYAAKVPFIMFYGTPQAGSFIARFLSVFEGDPLLKSMSNSGDNAYLLELENRWRERHYDTHRYCAYEEVKMQPKDLRAILTNGPPGADSQMLGFVGGIFVVDPFSATYGCDSGTAFTGIPENHINIVKPTGVQHRSYTLFKAYYEQIGQPVRPAPAITRYEEPLCAFYGESNSGGSAWHKDEVCPIKNAGLLDPDYRQGDFNCCGGGATSPMTNANIPAGLEIKTDGGYYWAVLNGTMGADGYHLHTYCGPGAAGQPGCNVKVKIVGHYKLTQ
jgi:pimeloyl-ACP methyl ester carboxylesterase